MQPHYSLLERSIETDLIPFCDRYGMGILPYFPLANGFLTGKYRKGAAPPDGTRLQSDDRGLFSDRNFEILEQLISFCDERGKNIIDLAFAWLLFRENVSSVIAGATKPDQVITNGQAGDWDLTPEEYKIVAGILQ